jgi:hypothetical protein
MADSHPYISGPGNIAQMVAQLRKSFPKKVTSDTVKKLGLAPNNESYVINSLQFIGLLDADGSQTDAAAKVFSHHKDEEFSKSLSILVKNAYSELFELHGDSSWSLDNDELITFFRQHDKTGDAIGRRQAGTFKVFSALSGHQELPATKSKTTTDKSPKKKTEKEKTKKLSTPPKINFNQGNKDQNDNGNIGNKEIGLTVRIEINLPSGGTKETYDNIFKSIKENLLNG